MSIEIETIKDAVYELEGLLELAELREDKLPALLPLMKNKLKLINTLFADSDVTEPEEEDILQEEEVEDTVENNVEAIAETPSVNVTETPAAVEESVDTTDMEDTVFANDFASEKVESMNTVEEDYPEDFSSSEEALFVADDIDEPVVTAAAASPARPVADPNAPKPAFCINDRFRFRRDLFGNSDAAFNSAMDMVATMDDYQEAEDYFIADLGWDTEKPEVMDFMAIIRSYFEK